MSFASIRKSIAKETEIYRQFSNDSDRCVIGLMTLGRNSKLDVYYFHLLEKLEKSLNTKFYMSDGSSGEVNLERYRKGFNINNSRCSAALEVLRKGWLSTPEARLICADLTDDACLVGLEDKELFDSRYETFSKAARYAADNVIMLDILLKRVDELSNYLNSNDLIKIDHWRQDVSTARAFVSLNVLPYDVERMLNDLFGAKNKNTIFSWFKEFQKLRRRYALPEMDRDFIRKLRLRILSSVNFYRFTLQSAHSIAKNIALNFKKYKKDKAFVFATGFIWYFLFEDLKKLNCSYLIIKTPSLDSIGANIENPNLDQEFIDYLGGKLYGVDLLSGNKNRRESRDDIFNLNNEFPKELKKDYCLLLEKIKREKIDVKNERDAKKFYTRNSKLIDSHVLLQTAENELGKKEYEASEQKVKKCIASLKEAGDDWCIAKAFEILGRIYLNMDNKTESVSYWRQAQSIYNRLQDIESESKVLYVLGLLEKEIGNYKEAKVHLNNSIRLLNVLDDLKTLAECFINRGQIYEYEEDYENAKMDYLEAKRIFEKGNNQKGIVKANKHLIGISQRFNEIGNKVKYQAENLKLDSTEREAFLDEAKKHLAKQGIEIDSDLISTYVDSLAAFFTGDPDWIDKLPGSSKSGKKSKK